MPLYTFDNNGLIDEVTVLKNASGGQRAYLHAREDATAEQLAEVMKQLSEHHYLSIPYKKDGKPVLEVRGFGKENRLMTTLKSRNLIGSQQSKKEVPEDRVSWLEKFKANSLWLVAFIYFIGDISFMTYEHMQAKQEESDQNKTFLDKAMDRIGGFGYFAGSLTLLGSLLAGKDTAEDEIQKASKHALEAAQRAGISFTERDALKAFSEQIDDRNKLAKTFSKYPSEMMNMCFAAAGVGISYTAHRKLNKIKELERKDFTLESDPMHKKEKRTFKQDIALGALTTTSGVLGTVLTEKKRDPNIPREKGVKGAINWLTEKPLRLAGYGYIASTLIHVVSSLNDRKVISTKPELQKEENKKERKEQLFGNTMRLSFVLASLVAEIIITLSSKGHGHGVKSDDTVDPTTCALVAERIHQEPKEERAELVDKMSEFLAMPDALGTDQDVLKKLINEKLADLDKNPWAAAYKKHSKGEHYDPAPAKTEGTQKAAWSQKFKADENALHPRINDSESEVQPRLP